MKILIVSDTHGREKNLKRVLEMTEPLDYMIHLGDSESGEERIRAMTQATVYMVAGNCDFFTSLPDHAVITIGGHRILITHGQHYFVSLGTGDLADTARKNNCEIAMFGHTHRPLIDQSNPHLTILNPGSLSFPRQENHRPSYILMTLDAEGQAEYELCYL